MAAISTAGAILKVSGAAIGSVTNVSLGLSRGTIETTAINTSEDSGKTFVPAGLYELGEVSFDLLYDANNTEHMLLLDAFEDAGAQAMLTYTLVVPTASTTASYVFDGFVTGWDVTLSLEDVVKASVTIKLTDSANEAIPST